jgi:diketogulonate reductase-like aldo/keto reductase
MSAPPAGGPTSTSSTSTRRSFVLGNTAAAAAAASASGASPAFAAAATAAATAAPSSRVIGRASGAISGGGLPLSVGLGTCLVRDGKSVVEQVSTAVAEGYRIFDTAQRYNNEAGVGRALRDAIGAGTLRREEVFLTTKVWCDNMGAEKTAPSVERSAARLRLDPLNSDAPAKIDLVLIHWPGNFVPFAGASKETLAANAALRKETWRALETLQAQGKVAQIGVSNYHERHFRELLSYAKVRPAVSQFEVHPYNARAPLIELCRREGVAVEAYSPLGGGGNANGVTAELLKDPVLTGIARRKKKTAAQVALRWHLQRGVTPIPKASSRKRIAENLAVFDFELSAAEMDAVSALDRGTFAIFDGDQLA